MGKYDRLEEFLKLTGRPSVELTFEKIEELIGDSLPHSAGRHAAWWANEADGKHVQARSWIRAGYSAHPDLTSRTVTFVPGSRAL